MEITPRGNETKPATQPQKNFFGWAAFIVTVGIILQQLYTHAPGLFTYYIPGFIDGSFWKNFTSADPLYGPLYRAVTALWTFNDFFITALLIAALVLLILRRKAVVKLLLVFVAYSGLFTLAVGIVMQNQLPEAVSGMTLAYNLESAAYLAADILLFIFYLKSRKFKALFMR